MNTFITAECPPQLTIHKIKILSLLFFLVIIFSPHIMPQVPKTISYQGILTDTSGVVKTDGMYEFTFRLYDSETGGSPLWTEMQSLMVEQGLFHAVLGSVTPFDNDIPFDDEYFMGVEIGSEGELLPRMPLTSSGYSFRSIYSDIAKNVNDSSLTSEKILKGQVVKKINGLSDNITLEGTNGATVTVTGNKITISAPGGGGGSITSIQNTDNTLEITNPSGPTTGVNMKVPLTLSGSSAEFLFKGENSGSGTGIFGLGGLNGVLGYSEEGYGLRGSTSSGTGVEGTSSSGIGGHFTSGGNYGVWGESSSNSGVGVYGVNTSAEGWAISGVNNNPSVDARGVVGLSNQGWGVSGMTQTGYGTHGSASGTNGYGIYGSASGTNGTGVYGTATSTGGIGVLGNTSNGTFAILGQNTKSGNIFWCSWLPQI